MPKDERYDFVIVGGGPNGVTLAAYLAKSGQSVCVLEERPEAGGACENTEPMAGVKINPHAIMLYGAVAPGFEQLELWKYGWRVGQNEMGDVMSDDVGRGVACTFGMSKLTEKDQLGFAKMAGLLTQPTFTKELLRSVFWCPPHPPEVEVTADNIPYMQVYKKYQPDVWTEELLDMDMFDLMDEYLESEPWKVQQAVIAWYSGAAGHWKGVAIPAWAVTVGLLITGRMIPPRGGMHDFFHCVLRCAVANGAVIRTCCPVDEIIINDGVAVGVRLRETATQAGKKIWANKAVISDVDVRQTFNKLVGPSHVDRGLLQKVNDISLKGGSIFNFHFYTKERLRVRKPWEGMVGGGYPQDSREIYYDHVADVDGRKGNPTLPPERALWLSTPYVRFEPTDKQVTRPDGHIMSPVYFLVPPPEYHVEGPDAINKIKDQMTQYIIKAMSGPYENLNSDNIIKTWTNTPYDSEYRNTGLIGGTWCGTRHCHDQWAENRPVPELARYRTPIDGLYLCNQTACHPGGLFLQAIPYNLMHILIEDGLVEPGPWWYSSPWYIPQDGKKSAKRPS